MSLAECFELAAQAGFDAVELNYDLEGYLSPTTSDREIEAIGKLARRSGIADQRHLLVAPVGLSARPPPIRLAGPKGWN